MDSVITPQQQPLYRKYWYLPAGSIKLHFGKSNPVCERGSTAELTAELLNSLCIAAAPFAN
jgi:hypothetical protein